MDMKIFDHSDREWHTTDHQLYSRNEDGQAPGHYMWVNGRSVLSNAVSENQKSKSINKYTYNQNNRNNGTCATISIVATLE